LKKGRRGHRGNLVPLSGGIDMTKGKAILDYLYGKKVVNVDVTELNVSLGEEEEVLESEKNVVRLLEVYL
jgi:arginase family enzyme